MLSSWILLPLSNCIIPSHETQGSQKKTARLKPTNTEKQRLEKVTNKKASNTVQSRREVLHCAQRAWQFQS